MYFDPCENGIALNNIRKTCSSSKEDNIVLKCAQLITITLV